jgi:hypothetical protein
MNVEEDNIGVGKTGRIRKKILKGGEFYRWGYLGQN